MKFADVMEDENTFKDLDSYAKETGRDRDVLIRAFEIESRYHGLINSENNSERRLQLYHEFYNKLLPIYKKSQSQNNDEPKLKICGLFEKELRNKRIIDFGCGNGSFLKTLARNYEYKSLTGIDVFIDDHLKSEEAIQFHESDIINFHSNEKYDVAFSDNVVEHISSIDLPYHLKSIRNTLEDNGTLIIITPNRLFGPSDITRIKDNSFSGKTSAEGGHLNESTYNELIEVLTSVGFGNFQTVLPIPKLKYSIFRGIRIRPSIIQRIEKSNFLLSLFRSIKIKGKCPIRFTITITCQKL